VPSFDVAVMLITCSVMTLQDENYAQVCHWNEHKRYLNFAHRILQSVEFKIKRLHSHHAPLDSRFFAWFITHAPWNARVKVDDNAVGMRRNFSSQFPRISDELLVCYLWPVVETKWRRYFTAALWEQIEWVIIWQNGSRFSCRKCIKKVRNLLRREQFVLPRSETILSGNVLKGHVNHMYVNLTGRILYSIIQLLKQGSVNNVQSIPGECTLEFLILQKIKVTNYNGEFVLAIVRGACSGTYAPNRKK
jgi:hypothetical protein